MKLKVEREILKNYYVQMVEKSFCRISLKNEILPQEKITLLKIKAVGIFDAMKKARKKYPKLIVWWCDEAKD